jgi:hypothetical protein
VRQATSPKLNKGIGGKSYKDLEISSKGFEIAFRLSVCQNFECHKKTKN